ncbi:MAG: HNH endonuclease [Candidatus Peribacteraceae bacterium]|nr:HNH endonuclease [Candidatus Peribacteraceae bacterium]
MSEIKRNARGQFVKGGQIGNQNAKGNPPNRTSFKKGQNAMEKSHNWGGGVQKNTHDCTYVVTKSNTRVRRPHLVWEKSHGKIQKGCVIWHIDGDKHNDALSNLEIITRGEMMKRNNPRVQQK